MTRPLEKNSHANFTISENAANQCMENGGGKHANIDMFVAHVHLGYNDETKSRT